MTNLRYQYSVDSGGVIRSICGSDEISVGYSSFDRLLASGPFRASERDLLRVMSSILCIDRLSPRRPTQGGRIHRSLAWQREIEATLTVEEPELWSNAVTLLTELLTFMTDDSWNVSFVAFDRPFVQQLPLVGDEDHPAEVTLFSGGLDSAAGLLVRGREHKGPIAAISACSNTVKGTAQGNAMRHIQGLGVGAKWIKVLHQLQRSRRSRRQMEASQRSRSLLFLAMGSVVASRAGLSSFSIFETGVGCINLPFSRAQIGAQNTRALHPRALLAFNRLASRVLDRPMHVSAPFFLLTKGQLCKKVGDALVGLAARASSCDEGEGNKGNPMEHCGLCTSCLFRRIAMHAAVGSADPTPYRDKITSRHGPYELKMLESQISEISKIQNFDDLVAIDPDIRFALLYLGESSPGDAQTRIVEMYLRYASEASAFLRQARPGITEHLRKKIWERNHDLFPKTR